MQAKEEDRRFKAKEEDRESVSKIPYIMQLVQNWDKDSRRCAQHHFPQAFTDQILGLTCGYEGIREKTKRRQQQCTRKFHDCGYVTLRIKLPKHVEMRNTEYHSITQMVHTVHAADNYLINMRRPNPDDVDRHHPVCMWRCRMQFNNVKNGKKYGHILIGWVRSVKGANQHACSKVRACLLPCIQVIESNCNDRHSYFQKGTDPNPDASQLAIFMPNQQKNRTSEEWHTIARDTLCSIMVRDSTKQDPKHRMPLKMAQLPSITACPLMEMHDDITMTTSELFTAAEYETLKTKLYQAFKKKYTRTKQLFEIFNKRKEKKQDDDYETK